MRTAILVALGVAVLGVVAAPPAQARPRPGYHESNFQANKTFGLGLELGDPTGLTGKYFFGGSHALDFGIGGYGYYADVYGHHGYRGVNLYLDYLWHPVSLVSAEAFELPFYIGIGGRILDDARDGYGALVSARVPIGISFDMNNIPFDFFLQLTPYLDFYSGYDGGFAAIEIQFSFGARFYFN